MPEFDTPSGELRSTFAAFFAKAEFRSNGSVVVTFTLPANSRSSVLDLADHEGYALNVAVWEQEVPDEANLAEMLGLDMG